MQTRSAEHAARREYTETSQKTPDLFVFFPFSEQPYAPAPVSYKWSTQRRGEEGQRKAAGSGSHSTTKPGHRLPQTLGFWGRRRSGRCGFQQHRGGEAEGCQGAEAVTVEQPPGGGRNEMAAGGPAGLCAHSPAPTPGGLQEGPKGLPGVPKMYLGDPKRNPRVPKRIQGGSKSTQGTPKGSRGLQGGPRGP